MRGLALTYAQLLEELDLAGVTVIGNSVGGWIAAEMAVHAPGRMSGVVLVDAGGLQVDGHPAADFFSLTPDQVTDLAYYQPERFRAELAALPEEAKAAAAASRAALRAYTAHGEHDEGFYVVAGTVRFTSGGTWFDAPARTLVMVPAGAPHSFANLADQPAIVLNTFTPDRYIGYFRELRDQIAAGRPLSAGLTSETMRRYATSEWPP
jgi:pimeloyl-ACP methyl ester carboxylesterase